MILPQDPVQAAIVHALNNHCHEDAIFLSERLFAEAPSDATLFLLATCYYQSGRKAQAYRFLRTKGYPTARCKYLYSRCCFDTGKLNEAEDVLTKGCAGKSKTIKEFSSEYGDTAAFAIGLLADVYRKTERHAKAIEYYQGSLALNPFMWSSFCKICKLGGKPDAGTVFHSGHVQDALNSVKSTLFSPQVTQKPQMPLISGDGSTTVTGTNNASTPMHTPTLPLISVHSASPAVTNLDSTFDQETSYLSTVNPAGAGDISFKTPATTSPSFGLLPLDTPLTSTYVIGTTPAMAPSLTTGILEVPQAPSKRYTKSHSLSSNLAPGSKLVFGQSSTSNTKSDVTAAPQRSHSQSTILPRRRSKRILDSQNSSNVKENSKIQARSKYTGPKSTSVRKARSTQSIHDQEELNTKNKLLSNQCADSPTTLAVQLEQLDAKQKQSAGALLLLLKDLGSAYCAAQSYDMNEAIRKYEDIPYHQYRTGWVLAEVGKAYLELSDYAKAAEVFEKLRALEPHQVNGMETYSTVLYHLQKEVALSALSQVMVSMDKLTPQTWCVNGNCFSLQKEHETAIKFLQRAIQVDNNFAYAYTLLGHEYTLIEDYDKAMSAFRNAIRVDTRHYNAWYGLGMIYYKKEKFTLAETHFKKAFSINPQNAVLLCHIGLVQHALQRHDVALETLNQAVELSPKNPLCLFHRASMLVANDRLEEALRELEALKVLTPKESLVYFLIGKVHKKLGNAHASMLNFSWATDLDPKGANNHIKEAIDRRYINDDDEEGEHTSLSLDSSVLLAGAHDSDLQLSADSSVVMLGEMPDHDASIFMDSDAEPQQLHANESDDSL